MRRIFFLLTAASVSFLLSCQKGDTGPEGPQGSQGPAGSQGPQGNPGTANVIYSEWLSVGGSEWKDTTMTNITKTKRVLKSAGALTQQILDSGVVLAYLKDVESNNYQLPFTYNINPSRVHAFIPTVGKIIFYEYATDGSGGVTSTTNKYRYIIIPGGVKTNGRVAQNWSKMSYNEVCQALAITR